MDPAGGIYCQGCFYDLRGLPPETRRCPECGRYFDPNAPGTYSTRPGPPTVREVLKKAAETAARAIESPNERVERLERQLRGRRSAAFAEVEHFQQQNERLRERLDWALALLAEHEIIGRAELAEVRAEMERSTRSIFEAIESPDDEAAGTSEELKALAAAANEMKRREDGDA